MGSRQATGLALMSKGVSRGNTMMQRGNTTMSMASMAALSVPLLDARDANGRAPIHLAALAGKVDMVRLLLHEAEHSPVGYERPASGFPVDNKGSVLLSFASVLLRLSFRECPLLVSLAAPL